MAIATTEDNKSPRLPLRDEEYLNAKGLDWRLHEDREGYWLAISSVGFDIKQFDREAEQGKPTRVDSSVELLIRIPSQYPQAKLDMFWVSPTLRIKDSAAYPNRADHFENHLGRKWQRFSRHLQSWRAGIDGLPMYLSLITRVLNPGRNP